jgi:hypothetical protein
MFLKAGGVIHDLKALPRKKQCHFTLKNFYRKVVPAGAGTMK